MSEVARAIIETHDLTKVYGFLPVLRGVNLSVERGQFLALLGANGSGKSTLLRIIAGLVKPTQGTVTVGGWQIPDEAHHVRQQMGVVSHKSLVYPQLTAYENLQFAARLYHIPEAETHDRIMLWLERVGLKRRANQPARAFSRGMQQRLSIARALLHQPHVLLLDEPHTGLDQASCATLNTLLQEIHTEGRTLLMTTHQLEHVPQLAQRVVILARGVLAYDAPPERDALALAHTYAGITGESIHA